MSESQTPQSQTPAQTPTQSPTQQSPTPPPKDPCGGAERPDQPKPPPAQKDPCDDPKPPDQKPPEKLPCPPPEAPCPPKKACPDPPKRPCPPPDPCVDKTTDGTAKGTPPPVPGPDTAEAQLAALKSKLEADQTKLQELEPLKTEMTDLVQRIQALEKTVDGQADAGAAYAEFYRSAEVFRSELTCFIPTVRCQITLTDEEKQCICDAIKAVETRVDKAKSDSVAANDKVDELERKSKRAADDLAWAKKWYEFLKSGLQQQVTKQRDDLKGLKQLADPKKDRCEVWFYLNEMERLLASSYGAEDACWKADLSIGTFLDCWRWDPCYSQAWNKTIVAFNDAEAAEKCIKSALEQAKKRAAELETIAKDAESKRREWILKEIKARRCCGSTSDGK